MANLLRIRTGTGTTIADFNDGTAFEFISYEPDTDATKEFADDSITFDILGSSTDVLFQNVQKITRAFGDARSNFNDWKRGRNYDPLFLEVQANGASYLLRSEIVDGDFDGRANLLDVDILSYMATNRKIRIKRRNYFEESSEVQIATSASIGNFGTAIPFSAIRGDLPPDLRIKIDSSASSQDRVLVAVKHNGTIASFLPFLECDTTGTSGYTVTTGTEAASLTDAQLSGGKGIRITPTNKTEYLRATIAITSATDAFATALRILLRARDNSATSPRFYWRARGGIRRSGGSAITYGDWTSPSKALPAIGGTTALPLLDLGLLTFPESGGSSAQEYIIELWGKTSGSATYPTADIDGLFLLPAFEGGFGESGFVAVYYPENLSSGALIGEIDSGDRSLSGRLVDGSANFLLPASDQKGARLRPNYNEAGRLFVITTSGSSNLHSSGTHTINAYARPRYRLVAG